MEPHRVLQETAYPSLAYGLFGLGRFLQQIPDSYKRVIFMSICGSIRLSLDIFPTMHLLHLHLWFRVALGFTLCSRLTYHRMPNAVPVRQVSGLPRASFRSCLATDTLASSYALGATSCARDFPPLDHAYAGRTKISPPSLLKSAQR